MRVLFTPLAERHLDALHRYISSHSSEDRADRYIGWIVSYCGRLSTFPLRGPSRDDILPGLRTIGFERRATIAFLVEPDLVIVEGIFYGGQDSEAIFGD